MNLTEANKIADKINKSAGRNVVSGIHILGTYNFISGENKTWVDAITYNKPNIKKFVRPAYDGDKIANTIVVGYGDWGYEATIKDDGTLFMPDKAIDWLTGKELTDKITKWDGIYGKQFVDYDDYIYNQDIPE